MERVQWVALSPLANLCGKRMHAYFLEICVCVGETYSVYTAT
jgi:hypothetical protein